MGLVIYRKSDNEVVMEVLQYPLHDTQIFENYIANGNYNANDYAKIEIPGDIMYKAEQKKIIIVDGKITFGEDRNPIVPEPLVPSEADELKAQNEILQIALAETIEKQETDKINNQIALAELVETLFIKGVL